MDVESCTSLEIKKKKTNNDKSKAKNEPPFRKKQQRTRRQKRCVGGKMPGKNEKDAQSEEKGGGCEMTRLVWTAGRGGWTVG